MRRLTRPVLQALGKFALVRKNGVALGNDQLVVLDLDSGVDKARVDVPSPCQGFLFPAPGFGRDIYYQSATTIARVAVVSFHALRRVHFAASLSNTSRGGAVW